MPVRLALAGDTMLGRKVGARLAHVHPRELFAPEVLALAAQADVLVANLECCISDRGQRWPDLRKPFFFRAPPQAVQALAALGADAVTLANNHALDYGTEGLQDTLAHLEAAGIAHVGAGEDLPAARAPVVLERAGFRLGLVALTDHPQDFAAGRDRAGVAFAPLSSGLPAWVGAAIDAVDADAVLVCPHWGPNMTLEPVPHVRAAARALARTGATLVAGHSAHTAHGVQRVDGLWVLYDLGDFLDDYAVDPHARNDLGLFWFVDLDRQGPVRIEAVPLTLGYCRTSLALPEDHALLVERLAVQCAALGTPVTVQGDRVVIDCR